MTFEAGLNKLRELNTGQCNLTGKTFGELIRHFIIGGDETCMHACILKPPARYWFDRPKEA
jgi:hypothetical protein